MPIPISAGDLAAEAVERTPLGAPGASGAVLERIRLADGQVLVRKSFGAATDWMMRATHDPGRAATLWTSGLMDRLPPVIDPAIVRIEHPDTPDGRAWVLYMTDVGNHFLRRGTTVTAAECRRLLDALAAMHATYWSPDPAGQPSPDLCSLEDLLGLASPRTAAREAGADPFIDVLRRGWTAFAELVPAEVRDGIRGVLDDPRPLAAALVADGATLTHSDPHYGNIAPAADRFYAVDWGLAAWAAPAVDFAWWLDQSAAFVEPSRDELIAAFREAEGPRHRERTLELALLAELALSGWQSLEIIESRSDEVRARRRADLDWWIARARDGLEHL